MKKNNNYLDKVQKECINCDICKKNCDFLTKYNINLKNFTIRKDIANNCFMCKKCNYVCPKDLDGSKIALIHRQNQGKTNILIKLEKSPYIFNNISYKKSDEVVYFGCNFPRVYPKTTTYLINLLKKQNIDFAIDCCGKPVFESGNIKAFKTNLNHNTDFVAKKSIKKLYFVCPNCYYFFKNNELLKEKLQFSDVEICHIYQLISKMKIGQNVLQNQNIFFPCPDKKEKLIFNDIKKFMPNTNNLYEKINCCGYGGLAYNKDKDVSEKLINDIKKEQKSITTYCATCSMRFNKADLPKVNHALTLILGTDEKPSKTNLIRLIMQKFIRHK